MLELVTLPLFAAFNRMRGDDTWMGNLPGRALYYVAGLVGCIAHGFLPPLAALAFALTYLVWGAPAWGRFYDLGRLPPDFAREGIEPDLQERFLSWISRGNDHTALFIRHCYVLPGLVVTGYILDKAWLAPMAGTFAVLATLAYEFAWRVRPGNPIWVAELLTGALWGLLLIVAANG